jgi:hypothetical protein
MACMNHSSLALLWLFYLIVPGRSNTPKKFWMWKGSCNACGKRRDAMNGLFCANFATARDCWEPCERVWCGECYTPPQDFKFYHFVAVDESGIDWDHHDKDKERHLVARAGDHLVTPFQCDLCVFRNLKHWNPLGSDRELMACIRQVNLDALWGCEHRTVNGTRCSILQMIRIWRDLDLEPTYPPIGTFSSGR